MKNTLGRHLAIALACIAPALSWAGTANGVFTQVQSVPTLDEWGLVGLIAVVGVVAGIAIRRGGKK